MQYEMLIRKIIYCAMNEYNWANRIIGGKHGKKIERFSAKKHTFLSFYWLEVKFC
jgi:hypothetical protein